MPGFLALPARDRIGAILDPGAVRWFESVREASVVIADGMVGGQGVVIAATDPDRAAGAIGADDAEALASALAAATLSRRPLLLLLDSAGARLTDGVDVLGGFRHLLFAALQTSSAGTPFLVLIGRFSFGGASLLASTAQHRFYVAGGQSGLSGPKAVLALNPDAVGDEVLALYANGRRAADDGAGELVPDHVVSIRAAIVRHMTTLPALPAADDLPLMRAPEVKRQVGSRTFERRVPAPGELRVEQHLVHGTAQVASTLHRVAGLVDGVPVSARACERLTQVFSAMLLEPDAMPVIVLLDSPGQATTPADEAGPFAMLLARLATTLFRLRLDGRRVELWITGQAGGAVYVALAAAADAVVAWPAASVATLPAAAVDSVLGCLPLPDHSDLIAAGVIDCHA